MEVHDVAQYVHWNLPLPEFYIQDLVPKNGVMLVFGDPKVKKSWLVQHMGFSIACGLPWLGFDVLQARAMVVNFEISNISYAWRLRNMFNTGQFPLQEMMFYETSPGLMYIDQTESFNAFMAVVRGFAPQVLILDCMAACYGGDENNGRDMAVFIEKLSQLKTELNCSIILVHHTNKNMMVAGSVNRARGHSRLTGWVDTLMYMADTHAGVQLQVKARQATREIPPINIRFNQFNWNRTGNNPRTNNVPQGGGNGLI